MGEMSGVDDSWISKVAPGEGLERCRIGVGRIREKGGSGKQRGGVVS